MHFTSKINFSAVSFSLKLQALIAAKRVLCLAPLFSRQRLSFSFCVSAGFFVVMAPFFVLSLHSY
jgi:hypothetical protein